MGYNRLVKRIKNQFKYRSLRRRDDPFYFPGHG